MKIKNLVITAAAVAIIGGTSVTVSTQSVQAYTNQPNYGIQTTFDVNYYSGPVYYFTEIINYNVKNILGKTASSTNLTEVLKNYKELYNFCYRNTLERNQYFQNLTQNEQIALSYLVRDWEERIASVYRDKYYFASTCNSVLGYKLTYVNDNYYETHREIMDKIEEKEKTYNKYMNLSATSSNLKSILEPYKYLLNFIKGTKDNGYYFTDLNPNERQDLLKKAEIWTVNIESKFGGVTNYNTTCRSKVNFIVNLNNLYNELNEVLNLVGNSNINTPIINPQNPILPTNPTTPGTIPPAVPSVPSTQAPVVQPTQPAPVAPNVPQTNNGQSANNSKINNTVGKDYRQNYIDSSIDTSRGVRDFIPESVNDVFGEDEYIRYPQNYYTNRYYDNYGNYIPYNNYNYEYYDGHTPDYAPSKVLK